MVADVLKFVFPIFIFGTFFSWVHVHSTRHCHDIQSSFWTSLKPCFFLGSCDVDCRCGHLFENLFLNALVLKRLITQFCWLLAS